MADFSCESADDVKYKKIVSGVHERIAKHMELECHDGPEEDWCKTVK